MTLLDRVHGRWVHSRRVRVLTRHLAPWLPRDARVLDVGCGDGQLAQAIAALRPDASITGIDTRPRPSALGAMGAFDGRSLPFQDDAFDAVLLADVLHHAEDPTGLLGEAARVARQRVLIKDHLLEGPGAGWTLRAMDWVGNARHGVDLPFRYWTRRRWWAVFEELGLWNEIWRETLGLYPRPAGWWLDRCLHFVAWLEPPSAAPHVPPAPAPPVTEVRPEARPGDEAGRLAAQLRAMGVSAWSRDLEFVVLSRGQGGGAPALELLGFRRVEGLDVSAALRLPCCDNSQDAVVLHGALHRLGHLPGDLGRVLGEVRRVLRPGGRVVIVEPWWTPLRGVVARCLRREHPVYGTWLSHPDLVCSVLNEFLVAQRCSFHGGQLLLVGCCQAAGAS